MLQIPDDEFIKTFVLEHNKIDPQPGHKNEPGDPHFDDHVKAAKYCIIKAQYECLAHPLITHNTLMYNLKGFREEAGRLRQVNVEVGGRVCPHYSLVPGLLEEWMRTMETWRDQLSKSEEDRKEWIWDRHVEYEKIHPFSDGNGRSGRLLMLNHALLLQLKPWYVEYAKRRWYYMEFEE